MTITLVNGSPKAGSSTSGLMLEYLTPQLKGATIHTYTSSKAALPQQLTSSDALVFAVPLYVDALPSHLLRQLMQWETLNFSQKGTKVYCIVTSGFYEGTQNRIAIEQLQHWCAAAKLTWGQAIGSGAGEMLPFLKNVPLGHGPNKNLGTALHQFCENILSGKGGDTLYLSPNFPRFLWRICGSLFVWYPRAKANGLKRKDLLQPME